MNNPRLERLPLPGASVLEASLAQPFSQRDTTGGYSAAAQTPASAGPFVQNESLFLTSLPVIDAATDYVCRRHRLNPTEADDFKSEVRLHLIDRNYTSSRRLALFGESNGGLLMGATLTQHPGLAHAVVARVGIFD